MRYRHNKPCAHRGRRAYFRLSHMQKTNITEKPLFKRTRAFLVEEGGFEPPKSMTADLQSAPFGRSGTLPNIQLRYLVGGAGGRTRTPDLLITNQLLYQLSYTSVSTLVYYTTTEQVCQHFFKKYHDFFIFAFLKLIALPGHIFLKSGSRIDDSRFFLVSYLFNTVNKIHEFRDHL